MNQFNRFGRQWKVFLEAEAEDRASAASIDQYYVRDRVGTMVPLSTLVSTGPINGPDYTNRFNLYRAAQIIGSAAPGYSSGQAQAALEEVARETLPASMGYDWADLSYQENKASGTAGPIFALSLLVVFLILAALYESWTLPFSVLLSVPIAIFGAFAGSVPAALRSGHLRADRPGDADRPRREERHPDRRIRARRDGQRQGCCVRRPGGRQTAPAPHPYDFVRFHSRLRAAGGGFWVGRGRPPDSWDGRRHRHAWRRRFWPSSSFPFCLYCSSASRSSFTKPRRAT